MNTPARTELERQVVAELRLIARLSIDVAAALETIRLPDILGAPLLQTYKATTSTLRGLLDTLESTREKAAYHQLVDRLAREGLLPPDQ